MLTRKYKKMNKTTSKIILISIILLGNISFILGQCPTENIILTTQESIDNFAINYPDCTELENDLTISGPNITNLIGLSQIESFFGGNLTIEDCLNLSNLEGLNNLNIIINGNLSIHQNENLSNISALASLTNVFGTVDIGANSALTSLNGLNNLTGVSVDLFILGNSQLTSLSALTNLTSVFGNVFIWITPLNNLVGLENLTNIGGLNIAWNNNLTDISAIQNINVSNIDDLVIRGNSQLSQCSVDNICAYLSNPNNSATINNNLTDCNSRQEILDICLLGTESYQFSELKVFPNPTNGIFYILGLEEKSIEVLDSQGRTVKYIITAENNYSISELSNGVYFLKITSNQGTFIKQLIKD